ncbi:MAG: hypothetical protein WCI57_02860 [Candidatus Berkelbacteria bacterium]
MDKQLNHKFIIALIILDLAWASIAAAYDWEVFRQVPVCLWPFLIICPVFPALLSLVWAQSLDFEPSNCLLAFGAIPSLIYFFAALIYYPTWMALNGFDWMTFGAIFWVLPYGLQAIYLILRHRVKFRFSVAAIIFLLVSFGIQYKTKTYGAQDFTNFSASLYNLDYLIMFLVALSFPFVYQLYWTTRHRCNFARKSIE